MTDPIDENEKPVEPLFAIPPGPRPDALFEKPGDALFEAPPNRLAKVSLLPLPELLVDREDVPRPSTKKPRVSSKVTRATTPKTPEEQPRNALAIELAKIYTRRVKLSKTPAVAAVVRKALEDNWTPEEIDGALNGLADRKQFVTVGTILYELRANAVHPDARPKFDPKVRRSGKPVDTAVYRFFNEDNVLLYIGQTPAPIERFHEHRDEKSWFDEVTHFSTDWHPSREDAEWDEDRAIADEWPIYNIKGQPRDNGGYRIPSYVASVLKQIIREAIEEAIPEARPEQAQAAVDYVSDAFDVRHHPDVDRAARGMWFGEPQGPTDFHPMDLDQAREGFGPYRAPVNGSTRVSRTILPPIEEETS